MLTKDDYGDLQTQDFENELLNYFENKIVPVLAYEETDFIRATKGNSLIKICQQYNIELPKNWQSVKINEIVRSAYEHAGATRMDLKHDGYERVDYLFNIFSYSHYSLDSFIQVYDCRNDAIAIAVKDNYPELFSLPNEFARIFIDSAYEELELYRKQGEESYKEHILNELRMTSKEEVEAGISSGIVVNVLSSIMTENRNSLPKTDDVSSEALHDMRHEELLLFE